jgi:hypothetical protein
MAFQDADNITQAIPPICEFILGESKEPPLQPLCSLCICEMAWCLCWEGQSEGRLWVWRECEYGEGESAGWQVAVVW